jgi:hypothetical protein
MRLGVATHRQAWRRALHCHGVVQRVERVQGRRPEMTSAMPFCRPLRPTPAGRSNPSGRVPLDHL